MNYYDTSNINMDSQDKKLFFWSFRFSSRYLLYKKGCASKS